ncbi:SDR family oxidoreductase [Candidatus Roizmanbacteria bacterium CG_4_10_14_0_8_um_filter_39_9]|uniref:SDR family oxidoreductase n=1 Tax=Candidatus Roizmanbacteria bacterium CG_4_10_14_0_8_um_filter_39_9 TaxID=1974829 RepID=A0A2M7QDY9_9BACT|nr:MAG: SDR family oxidoreductase [Candidatus Roizmanbacteria bacterium CG_4_10_14_0_8_um_filter_39_9]
MYISNNKLLDLTGKVAFVTGGAVGIGHGITNRLAEAGAKVMMVGRTPEELNVSVSELIGKGYVVKSVTADVSSEEDVKRAVDETIKEFGGIDIMVNNAGIFPMMPLASMTLANFEQVLNVNLKGVFLTTKHVSDHMKATNRMGRIINITSIDALHPSMVGLAHYDASKHGVWGFTKNVALELAPFGITVNAVAPGGIATPGVAKMNAGAPASEEAIKAFMATLPMKRMGDPDDIGKVVLFLASDMSSYMTGSQVVVDGGALIT